MQEKQLLTDTLSTTSLPLYRSLTIPFANQWGIITGDTLLQYVQMYVSRLRNHDSVSAFTANHKQKDDCSSLISSHCRGHSHTKNKCWVDGSKNGANWPKNYRGQMKPKENIATVNKAAPSASLANALTEFYAAFMAKLLQERGIALKPRYLYELWSKQTPLYRT